MLTRFRPGKPDPRRSLRSTRLPTVRPADPRPELGPCSLGPAALFGARLPSVFETTRRLTISATAYDVRATKPELCDPRGDGGHDLLPLLTCHAAPLRER
jgi:hypothetical protein